MRRGLKKRPEELDAMRRAVAISCEAHKDAMRRARGGDDGVGDRGAGSITRFRSRGAAAGPSYPSIIASGPERPRRFTTSRTTARMQSGDLLLIDAGCEVDFLRLRRDPHLFRSARASTRRSGALYSVVLEAQRAWDRIDKTRRALRRRA